MKSLLIKNNFWLVMLLCISVSACQKDSPVPCYLDIQPFTLTTSSGQGSNATKITDVWLYVNEKPLGAYSLPCHIPIIQEGSAQILLSPGVFKNGISTARIAYPFYQSYIDTINFEKGKTYKINPTTKYISPAYFKMSEDFEQGSPFVKYSGDTIVNVGNDANNFEKKFGRITLDATHDTAVVISTPALTIPASGNTVWMEMNYKCDREFTVGLQVKTASAVYIYWHATLNARSDWNKVYFDFSDEINRTQGTAYQLLISAGTTDGSITSAQNIYFDNIKIISQKN